MKLSKIVKNAGNALMHKAGVKTEMERTFEDPEQGFEYLKENHPEIFKEYQPLVQAYFAAKHDYEGLRQDHEGSIRAFRHNFTNSSKENISNLLLPNISKVDENTKSVFVPIVIIPETIVPKIFQNYNFSIENKILHKNQANFQFLSNPNSNNIKNSNKIISRNQSLLCYFKKEKTNLKKEPIIIKQKQKNK